VNVKVLLVDDDDSLRQMLVMALSLAKDPAFETFEASSHDQAMQVFAETQPDVVLMDLSMPGADGDETTRAILEQSPSCKVLAHTGHRDKNAITRMLVAGACGYVVKGGEVFEVVAAIRDAYLGQRPIDAAAMPGLEESIIGLARSEAERRQQLEEAKREVETSHQQAVLALAQALKSRDGETGSHVDRVVTFSVMVAKQLGLSEEQIEDVRYGAIFHDIGKLGIPDSILLGSGELSSEQRETINTHTIKGERILQPVEWLRTAAKNVRSHHENWDGTGYPDKLSGEDIPLGARIIRVCDTFDAMTCGRRYQDAMNKQDAIERIKQMAGAEFDPKVVHALVAVHAKEKL
jgi:response regulator RpfG family c-di-GMP phosphodiesterase